VAPLDLKASRAPKEKKDATEIVDKKASRAVEVTAVVSESEGLVVVVKQVPKAPKVSKDQRATRVLPALVLVVPPVPWGAKEKLVLLE